MYNSIVPDYTILLVVLVPILWPNLVLDDTFECHNCLQDPYDVDLFVQLRVVTH